MRKFFSPHRFHKTTPKVASFGGKWLSLKLFWKIVGGVFLAGCLGVLGIFAYYYKDLPSPGKLNNRFVVESTKIFDRTGNHLLYEIHGEEKRTQIALKEIPESVRYATISLEDQNFYLHHGIQFKAILRALFKDILNRGAAQGGSTITQQLIKQSLLTSEKTLSRKIKEVILAIELEQKFSKDEILEMYLNEIPYGSNAYGIEAAANTFFDKSARELTLDEAALLAALPKAPTYYSPYGSHIEELKGRQEHALQKMTNLGYITAEQAEEAKNANVKEKIKINIQNIHAPHFVMYIREYLEKKYGQQVLEQGGLRVYTTLDWEKQQIAERAVKEGAEKNTKSYDASNAALLAMDPKTGQILAMVGSKDYFDKSIDGQVNVTTRDRQPGSSFKPYVYLAAFEKGYTPETNIWDVDTDFSTEDGKSYNPKNYDGKNNGLMQMKDALARSLNVPAVKTLYLVGVKNAVILAKKMGINTLTDPDRYGLSLVLGGGEIKLLEHVNAFSTIATGGIKHEKTAILRVEDKNGEVLEEYKQNQGERVIEEKYVAMLDYVLSTNSLRAPVFGEKNPLSFGDRQVAAKTGTTNEWRDGWTIGYTPSLAVGVWAGNNDNKAMKQGADGVYVAAPIWRSFFDQVLINYNIEEFPKYEPEETKKAVLDGKLEMKKELDVCEIPGEDKYCLANEYCPKKEREEKKFADGHSILYYLNKDDPRSEEKENSKNDPQFENWEKAVKKWLKDNDYSTDPVPEKECEEKDFKKYQPDISIKSPSDGQTITSSSFDVSIKISAPYGVDKAQIKIDGETVKSSDDSSFSYSYSVPDDKKNKSLKIEASVEDENGNSESTSINIKTEIP